MKTISLSQEQEAAVSATGSRVVTVATAGSGKSRCLVERAKRCANPGNTVICSFTNSAADELRERLAADGCDPHRFRSLSTLHSWALREMSRFGTLPTILGDAEKDEAIDAVMKRLGAMARNMSKKEAWRYAMDPPPFGAGASVGKAIRAFFRSNGATHIDFVLGDFLARCGEVAVPDEMLIDEVQDSGELDFEIYNAFAARGSRLWLVGDIRQSIYGFRGARPDIMLAETLKPDTQVFQLRTNYRSVPAICRYGTRLGRAMTGMDHLDAEIVPFKNNP
jgi:superfamily I DNA/RNA helicase